MGRMKEIGDGTITGRVVAGGFAQSVTREDGLTTIRLTAMPGQPLPADDPSRMEIEFPEPVPVEAGEMFCVVFDSADTQDDLPRGYAAVRYQEPWK